MEGINTVADSSEGTTFLARVATNVCMAEKLMLVRGITADGAHILASIKVDSHPKSVVQQGCLAVFYPGHLGGLSSSICGISHRFCRP